MATDKDIMNIKVRFTFLDDDFTGYTEDEKVLEQRIKDITYAINNFDSKDLYYTKESILNPYILRVLAHCIENTDKDLDEDRLDYLITNYNKINDFINNNDNYEEIIKLYGNILHKDSNGFYEIDDNITNKILQDNNFKIETDNEPIKDAINSIWVDKKDLLNPNDIDTISEQQNGINFKQFIFCEEYLKRGKIKPTCDYLGISRSTAYEWLKDKKVQKYLDNRKQEIKRETDTTFINTYNKCIDVVDEMINSPNVETNDKIRAIGLYLRHYENIERVKTPPHSP